MVASFVILNLLVEILYLLVVYINYAVNSSWVYGFLDVTIGLKSFLWYLGLFIGSIVLFFIMLAVHMLRDHLGKKFGHRILTFEVLFA
ncbi:3327_t:CDS:2 [Funneliformis geosporum]|nr:3327_t:CDS:2 [Funneliformis geosporum]